MWFTLKKFFWDLWDNAIWGILMNAIAMVPLVILLAFSDTQFGLPMAVYGALLFVASIWGVLGIGIINRYAHDVVNYQKPERAKLLEYLRKSFGESFFFLLFAGGINYSGFYAFTWYREKLPPEFALAAFFAVAFVLFFFNLGFMYFLAYRTQTDGGLFASLRRGFILLFNNFWYSFFIALMFAIFAVFNFVTAMVIPGIFGLVLWLQVALKLRLYKYEFLKENSDAKKIPWKELWIDEETNLGKRNFKSIFMPWRD